MLQMFFSFEKVVEKCGGVLILLKGPNEQQLLPNVQSKKICDTFSLIALKTAKTQVLAVLRAIGLTNSSLSNTSHNIVPLGDTSPKYAKQKKICSETFNPTALKTAKTLWSFGRSESNRVNEL